MIRTLMIGKKGSGTGISILEVPTNTKKKFLLVVEKEGKTVISEHCTREELQKLNEAIAEVIAEDINTSKS